MPKQVVYVIGATGEAGSSIVDGLLRDGSFNVTAGIRPSSLQKPEIKVLESRGVEIRALDLENWSIDQVAETLKDVDTVISAIFALQLHLQKPLADACKKAGVKRLIPCDWGPACTRGVSKMFDTKEEIHDYIENTGVGYTFIDVGWWYQCLLPYPDPSKAYRSSILDHANNRFGSGDVKCAITDSRDIGKFVARIIRDMRTLNRYVFCWTDEVTQSQALALAGRVSGRKFEFMGYYSEEEIVRRYEEVRTKEGKGGDVDPIDRIHFDYWYSLWVRGDNTAENAKKEEYGTALDARELYPDLGKELRSLEEYAKELYSDSS